MSTALQRQIGGGHYKDLAIQPMQFSEFNELSPTQHTACKYLTRHQVAKGKEDVEKAIHCAELMLELAESDWVVNLMELTTIRKVGDYRGVWSRMRKHSIGRSIAERRERGFPIILPGVYSAANHLPVEECTAIELLTWAPTRENVQFAIGTMNEILQRDYP